MKICKLIALTLIITLGISMTANAGFLIEPFIDYAVTGETKDSTGSEDLSTFLFGARVGMTTLGLMYGLEYTTGDYTVKTSTDDFDGSHTHMGAFIGYNFPAMFRAWATYYLSSSATPDIGNVELKGSGYKIGIGYTGLPFISINLQMMKSTFDEAELGSTTVVLTDEITMETVLLGISLPLP